jgi:hypothetical protein
MLTPPNYYYTANKNSTIDHHKDYQQEQKPKTIPMPPKRATSTGKTKPSSNVRAGRRKYVLDEAREGEEENEGISQKEIDEIYNGISDHQDQDDPKEDIKNYILPKKTKLDHVNPSENDTDANGEAIHVGRPTKDRQTAVAMVSPDKGEHRLPPAQNKTSSWPSVGHINLTTPATRSSQQEPDDGTFALPSQIPTSTRSSQSIIQTTIGTGVTRRKRTMMTMILAIPSRPFCCRPYVQNRTGCPWGSSLLTTRALIIRNLF